MMWGGWSRRGGPAKAGASRSASCAEVIGVFTKRSVIAILVGVNLILLGALMMQSYALPAAFGQGGGRPGDFVCVTAKAAGQTYDVLYVLDVPARKLYGFYPPSGQAKRLTTAPPRDLAKDFGR